MLTSGELALAAAGIGILSTALGGFIAWAAGRRAAREQRRLEADRRRDDRRAALYQELLAAIGEITRAANGSNAAQATMGDLFYALSTTWSSRVDLFASREVKALFEQWVAFFVKLWGTRGEQPVNAAEAERRQNWQQRMERARGELPEQMRKELETW